MSSISENSNKGADLSALDQNLGVGDSTVNAESTVYSSFSDLTMSSSPPIYKLYDDMVANYLMSTDRIIIRAQILKVREMFNKRIEKWKRDKQDYEAINANRPEIEKLIRRIRKAEKLSEKWTGELSKILERLIKEEEEENDADFESIEDDISVGNVNDFSEEEDNLNQWMDRIQKNETETQNTEQTPKLFVSQETAGTSIQTTPFSTNPGNLKYEMNLADFNRKHPPKELLKTRSEKSHDIRSGPLQYKKRLRNTVHKLKPFKEGVNKTYKELNQLRREVPKLKEKNKEKDNLLSSAYTDIKRFNKLNSELTEKLNMVETNETLLRKINSELDTKNKALEEKIRNQTSKQDLNLKDRIEKLQRDLASANSHFFSREAELTSLKETNGKLNNDISILSAEKTELKMKNEENLIQITELEEEIKRLRIDNSSKLSPNLQVGSDFWREKFDKSNEDKEDLSRELLILEREKSQMASQLAEFRTKNEYLTDTLRETKSLLQEERENGIKMRDDLREKGRRLKEELVTLRNQNDDLTRTMTNSLNNNENTFTPTPGSPESSEHNFIFDKTIPLNGGQNTFGPKSSNNVPESGLQNSSDNQNKPQNNSQQNVPPVLNINRNPSIKPKVPTFDGEFEKAIEWYDEFKVIANHYQWTDEEMVKYVRMNLTGSAKDWFIDTFIPEQDIDLRPFTSEPLPTWYEFSEKFMKEYRPKGCEIALRRRLQNISKNSNESYVSYMRRINLLIRGSDNKMSESERVMHIRDGLKRDPKFQMISLVETLNELKDFLRRFDQSSIVTKPTFQYKQNYKSDRSEPKNENLDSTSKTTPRPINRDIECLNCLKTGHYYKDCSQPLLEKKILNQRLNEKRAQRTGKFWSDPKLTANKSQNVLSTEEVEDEEEERKKYECHTFGIETESNTLGNEIDFSVTSISISRIGFKGQDLNIKNLVRDLQSPLIDIEINGMKLEAMIDTGAAFTLVSTTAADKIKAERSEWPFPKLKAVDNREVTPKEMFESIKVNLVGFNISIIVSVGIMPNMTYEMILGMDFLNKAGIAIDVPHKRIYISDSVEEKFKDLSKKN